MSSPFHAIMTTPVLYVRDLARLMREHAARVDDPASRADDETDAVLLGKLAMLDALAGRMWCEKLGGNETTALQAAANELGRAVEILTKRIAAAAGDARAAGLTDFKEGARDPRGHGMERVDEMEVRGAPTVARCSSGQLRPSSPSRS